PARTRVLGMACEEKREAHLKRLSARDESQFPQEVEAFGQRRRACEKAALAIYKEMTDLIKAEQLEADDFHGKSRGFWAFFKNPLRDGRAVLRTFLDGEGKSTWRKTVEKGFLVDESRGGAAAALQRLYEKMQALDTARYVYEAALEKNLYALALMKRADDLKNDIQKAEGRVPISEFNRKIHDLLGQTDVPYLYERVGALYRHILVDEFQDTSTLQWENLRPLIDNNRASGQWNMVVGDPKQSIYRFRSANVEQMLALREDDALAQNEKLVSNWRSDAGIIAFNNLFYRFLLEGFAPEKAENAEEWARIRNRLQRIYTEHEQFYKTATDRLPDEDAQAVRVCFYEKNEDESYEDWNCRLIQAILQRHRPGDVAVLCTRNDRVQTVASRLVENGVKVHTDSSLLLRSSLTVRLLVAALRYMGMPDSETARRKLLWFLAQRDTLDGTGAEAGDGGARLRYLRGLANSGRSLYDKLQHILRRWALRADTDQYVLSFMDLVQQSGLRAEADFVREWEDNWAGTSMVQTAAGRADAVRVTTVHKSKGLEYPVVIYAFASDAPRPDGWVWTDLPSEDGLPVGLLSLKDAAAQTVDGAAVAEAADEQMKAVVDRINVLYVTTTRPRHKLYVLSKGTKGSGAYAENRYWEQFTMKYPAYLAAEDEWTEDGAAAATAGASSAAAAGDTVDEETACMAAARRDMAARQTDWMPRFEPAFSWRDTVRRPERIWGEFIHRVLSGIDDACRFDRAAVEAVVAEQWPEVALWLHDGYEAPAAVAQVEAVLAHPSLKPCFSSNYRIYNERELC
ncbi:MAG: UvrD-helicase domain-containing protein, partial [Bacteroidales bacterium]|nr:UvrD-helicase domain-containing protein [Bacteroidales bacterium]